MKNKREIILDFTSLLDVVMLILFFFIIFAQSDANKSVKSANEKAETAEQRLAEANEKWDAAEEAMKQAGKELDKLQKSGALAEAIIINGTADFEKALRLKLVLDGEKDDWTISVQSASQQDNEIIYEEIGSIPDVRRRDADETASDFKRIIIENGYSENDAFLCDLMYNSGDSGSRLAKNKTDEMLDIFQNVMGYKYLFASTTDLSEIED